MNFYQWTGSPEILRVKPNGDFELANGVEPLVALGQLSKAFMKQQDRIKRLEEAGDALFELCDASPIQFELVDQIPQRLKAWEEAKEDKP